DERNFGHLAEVDSASADNSKDVLRNVRPYYTAITFIAYLICSCICETISHGLSTYLAYLIVVIAVIYSIWMKMSPALTEHRQPANRKTEKNAFVLSVLLWIVSPILLFLAWNIIPNLIRGPNWIKDEGASFIFFLMLILTAVTGGIVFVSYLLGGLFTGIFTFFSKRK
ncbi:MAG: hypothetical protein ACRC2T_13520, partial [Thermoguttaceae bacterium]